MEKKKILILKLFKILFSPKALPSYGFLFGFTASIRSWHFFLSYPYYGTIIGCIIGSIYAGFSALFDITGLSQLTIVPILAAIVHRCVMIRYNMNYNNCVGLEIIKSIENWGATL